MVLPGDAGATLDVGDRKAAIEGRPDPAGKLTVSVRPERIRVVAPDSPEATLRAKVTLVEPLGPKDILHLSYEGYDIRAVSAPGNRPRVGDNLGLAVDPAAVHVFDDETGLALR